MMPMTDAQHIAYRRLADVIDKCSIIQIHAHAEMQPLELSAETLDLIREGNEALKQAQRVIERDLIFPIRKVALDDEKQRVLELGAEVA